MSNLRDTTDVARDELLPLISKLCALTHEQGVADQAGFFRRIAMGVEQAREPDDLAGPFMELSTSAFMGFDFSLEVSLVLDDVLSIAQTLSATLSASSDEVQ